MNTPCFWNIHGLKIVMYRTHLYAHPCTSLYKEVCTLLSIHPSIHPSLPHSHASTHIHTHTYIHIHTHTCINMCSIHYTQTYIHMHTHIHTHTHTCTCIALHCVALRCIALHYITLHTYTHTDWTILQYKHIHQHTHTNTFVQYTHIIIYIDAHYKYVCAICTHNYIYRRALYCIIHLQNISVT